MALELERLGPVSPPPGPAVCRWSPVTAIRTRCRVATDLAADRRGSPPELVGDLTPRQALSQADLDEAALVEGQSWTRQRHHLRRYRTEVLQQPHGFTRRKGCASRRSRSPGYAPVSGLPAALRCLLFASPKHRQPHWPKHWPYSRQALGVADGSGMGIGTTCTILLVRKRRPTITSTSTSSSVFARVSSAPGIAAPTSSAIARACGA
jgi:hypothetical protein